MAADRPVCYSGQVESYEVGLPWEDPILPRSGSIESLRLRRGPLTSEEESR